MLLDENLDLYKRMKNTGNDKYVYKYNMLFSYLSLFKKITVYKARMLAM